MPKAISRSEPIPIEVQIVCAKRELAMRKRNYPTWVAAKRMNPYTAQEEIATMQAIVVTLESHVRKLI